MFRRVCGGLFVVGCEGMEELEELLLVEALLGDGLEPCSERELYAFIIGDSWSLT